MSAHQEYLSGLWIGAGAARTATSSSVAELITAHRRRVHPAEEEIEDFKCTRRSAPGTGLCGLGKELLVFRRDSSGWLRPG